MLQTLNNAMTIYNKSSDDKDCTLVSQNGSRPKILLETHKVCIFIDIQNEEVSFIS